MLYDKADVAELGDSLRDRSAGYAERGGKLNDVELRAGIYFKVDYLII